MFISYFDGGIVQFQMPQIPALILAGAVAALFACAHRRCRCCG